MVLRWIVSFITCRTQTVNFAGHQSKTGKVLCGVPQGSHLRRSAFPALNCWCYCHCSGTWLSGTLLCWWYAWQSFRNGTRLQRLKECISKTDRCAQIVRGETLIKFVWLGTKQHVVFSITPLTLKLHQFQLSRRQRSSQDFVLRGYIFPRSIEPPFDFLVKLTMLKVDTFSYTFQ